MSLIVVKGNAYNCDRYRYRDCDCDNRNDCDHNDGYDDNATLHLNVKTKTN